MIESCQSNSHERQCRPIASLQLLARGPGRYLLQVSGELDISTTPLVLDAIRAVPTDARDLAIDLQLLSFIDLSGLRSIIDAIVHAAERGYRARVTHPGRARRLASLVGLDDTFESGPNRPERRADQARPWVRRATRSANVIAVGATDVNEDGGSTMNSMVTTDAPRGGRPSQVI